MMTSGHQHEFANSDGPGIMAKGLMRKPTREPKVADESARVDLVLSLILALIGLGLVGVGIWGFWASADIGYSAAASYDYDRAYDDQLIELASVLTWLVIFAPCLVGGAILLWKTFTRENDTWLAPLRTFNFILAYKILGQTRRKNPSEQSCIDIPSLDSEHKLLNAPQDAACSEVTPEKIPHTE